MADAVAIPTKPSTAQLFALPDEFPGKISAQKAKLKTLRSGITQYTNDAAKVAEMLQKKYDASTAQSYGAQSLLNQFKEYAEDCKKKIREMKTVTSKLCTLLEEVQVAHPTTKEEAEYELAIAVAEESKYASKHTDLMLNWGGGH